MIHLTSSLGDFRILTIPLEKEGVAFSPNPSTGALIFTAKRSYQDADTAAIIQKSSTAGITLNGGIALISLYREDTVALDPCKLFFEILWQDTGSLLAQPIAVGILDLSRRLTRSQQTSIPVVSTATPLPFGGGGTAALELTAVPISGATPTPAITVIGQPAIVSHTGGTFTEWGAASLTQWLPRTAGILKHANGLWYRASLAADGTAQYDLLPNQ